MKSISMFTAVLLTAISSAFAEKMELVTVSEGEVVQFQIAVMYTADSCNSVSVADQKLDLISNNYNGGKLYQPFVGTMQTVMGCSDNKTTQETIVADQVYTTKADTTVRLLLPEGYSIIVK